MITDAVHRQLATGVANSALGSMPGEISYIDEVKSCLFADIVSKLQRLRRGWRQVLQLMMRIKPSHMPGGQLAQVIPNPARNAFELSLVIVHGGDHISHHLNMHVPLLLGPLRNLQNATPAGNLSQLEIEVIGEALDINTPAIEIRPDSIQSLLSDEAIGYVDGIEVLGLGQLGSVQGILEPDCGLVIGPSDASTVILLGQLDRVLGGKLL